MAAIIRGSNASEVDEEHSGAELVKDVSEQRIKPEVVPQQLELHSEPTTADADIQIGGHQPDNAAPQLNAPNEAKVSALTAALAKPDLIRETEEALRNLDIKDDCNHRTVEQEHGFCDEGGGTRRLSEDNHDGRRSDRSARRNQNQGQDDHVACREEPEGDPDRRRPDGDDQSEEQNQDTDNCARQRNIIDQPVPGERNEYNEGETTSVKEVFSNDDQGHEQVFYHEEVYHEEGDPERRRPENDQDRRSEGGDQNQGQNMQGYPSNHGQALPPVRTEAEWNDIDNKRLEDVFQDIIIPQFANSTEFKKFARSSSGLALNEEDITAVQDSESDEKCMEMLLIWQQRTTGSATPRMIYDIMYNYLTCRPCTQTSSNHLGDAVVRVPEVRAERLEDVFQEKIIPVFANMGQFKKFARAGKGLRLHSQEVSEIVQNHSRDAHAQKMEILKLWRQNTEGADAKMIMSVLIRYFNQG